MQILDYYNQMKNLRFLFLTILVIEIIPQILQWFHIIMFVIQVMRLFSGLKW